MSFILSPSLDLTFVHIDISTAANDNNQTKENEREREKKIVFFAATIFGHLALRLHTLTEITA